MARNLLCLKCHGGHKDGAYLTEGEARLGWRQRIVFLSQSKLPDKHGYSENGKFTPMTEARCDNCNDIITGEIVVAVSLIPPDKEMRDWEHEYGEILPPETVALYEKVKNA